jgi:hypothetical protein
MFHSYPAFISLILVRLCFVFARALLCFREAMYSNGDMTFYFSPSFTFRYWPFTGHNAALAK